MKRYLLLYILVLCLGEAHAQNSLKGVVIESAAKQPVPGATIYIPDLKKGAVSDEQGKFIIKGLPAVRLFVQVKLIGFSTVSRFVNVGSEDNISIELTAAAVEASEVVVTGSPFTTDNSRTSLSVTPVEKKVIQESGSNNIAAALEKVPGLSNISTGGAIGKPVIRGLGYNRIVTIQEGTRQEGQQWGDEHGLEIEEFAADRIEVLKGPGSLMYGSDALGGVIHVLEPVPPSEGTTNCEINSKYSTNGNATTLSGLSEGNLNGFVWAIRGTKRSAAAYKTPEEYIYNSAFNEKNGNVMLGLNRKWGFSHLHFSSFNSNLGLVEGERDSLSGHFTDAEGNVITDEAANSKAIYLPQQKIEHVKASLVNSFFIRKSVLKVNAAYQENNRKEFEDDSNIESLFFHLQTFTADARFYFPEKKGFESVVGVSGMYQTNTNKGEEFLIPDYNSNEAGVFVSVKKNYTKATWNAGLRYDIRSVEGQSLFDSSELIFKKFQNVFSAVSGSAGFTYELSKRWNAKANVGRGFRSPNISELSSNGVHEGTFRYEIGNTALKPETSLQFDAGLSYDAAMISSELDIFYNLIDNFIYYRNFNNEIRDIDGTSYPVYRYIQGTSALKGFEFTLDLHPFDALHFENSASWVDGDNLDINKPLPYIPAFHFRNEITFSPETGKQSCFKESYITIGIDNYLKQDNIDEFETLTKGYSLFYAGLGTNIILFKQQVRFYVLGENLLDKAYVSHLNRLKQYGIHNQGRNFTFGLTVKLSGKLGKTS